MPPLSEEDRQKLFAEWNAMQQNNRKPEPWIQKNWPTLLSFAGQLIVALLLIGKMSAQVEQLQANIAEMKSVMVQKDTVDLEFQTVKAQLASIKENQEATDKRVEKMEERQLDARK